jgi:ketosteroid isomerase-like protein
MATKLKNYLTIIAIILLAFAFAQPQSSLRPRRVATTNTPCVLNGTYRIDVTKSDRLYSVVRNAQSTVPFGEQQQFFLDLTTRLTPPDMLAIECRGRQVSVGSSRASKISYYADGKNRRERSADGSLVNSKITLTPSALTFVSVGKVEDNVNVAFQSLDEGRKMRVTRKIYAAQLTEPIIIQTVYDKISDAVDWKIYDGDLVAGRTTTASTPQVPAPENAAELSGADMLRRQFASWLDATNRRDIEAQMRYYMPQMKAYYLTRNVPQQRVRVEKERVFGVARSVDIRAGEPEIIFQDQGRVAIMRFVKEYRVTERTGTRKGAVVQELRWQRTNNGWRIFSERDVRVIR